MPTSPFGIKGEVVQAGLGEAGPHLPPRAGNGTERACQLA